MFNWINFLQIDKEGGAGDCNQRYYLAFLQHLILYYLSWNDKPQDLKVMYNKHSKEACFMFQYTVININMESIIDEQNGKITNKKCRSLLKKFQSKLFLFLPIIKTNSRPKITLENIVPTTWKLKSVFEAMVFNQQLLLYCTKSFYYLKLHLEKTCK